MNDVKTIDALLPQTQCGECGFAGCLPYAQALAQGHSTIDRCPPGGVNTVKALAEMLGVDASPYLQSAIEKTRAPSVAIIREKECIGCTKCIQACPVDAIVGAAKLMHSIITNECTGCGLCVEPCPVDCIEMQEQEDATYQANNARDHFKAKQIRLIREQHEQQQAYREKRKLAAQSSDMQLDIQAKRDYIQQAMARVNAKKS